MKQHDIINLDKLVGTWNLEQYYIIDNDGNRRELWNRIKGRLIYTSAAQVAVVIVKDTTEPLISETMCYSGSFKIRNDYVEHNIFVSTIKRYENSIEIRKIRFENEFLILRNETHKSGLIHEVHWKKFN